MTLSVTQYGNELFRRFFPAQTQPRRWNLRPAACVLRLTLVITLSPAAFSGEVYKHIAADGSVTYSDDPLDHSTGAAAEPLALPASVVVPEPIKNSPSTKPKASNNTNGSAAENTSLPFRGYQQFAITSPTANGTIRNNNGTVEVNFQLTPALQTGHTVQAVIDGNVVARWQQASTNSVLSGIQRGSHQLRLEALNADGMAVGRSQTVTFHMHQNSALLRPSN